MTAFGSTLKGWRLARSLTQRQVAEALEVTPTYVNLLERGRTKAPTLHRCRQLAEILGLDEREVIHAALEERDPGIRRLLDTFATAPAHGVPLYHWHPGTRIEFAGDGRPSGDAQGSIQVSMPEDRAAFALAVDTGSSLGVGDPSCLGQWLVFSPQAGVRDGDLALACTVKAAVLGEVHRQAPGAVEIRALLPSGGVELLGESEQPRLCRLVRRIELY